MISGNIVHGYPALYQHFPTYFHLRLEMDGQKVHVSWKKYHISRRNSWKLFQFPGFSMEFHVIPGISSITSMVTLDNVHPGGLNGSKVGL